jgi:hypothetical protein
VGDQQRLSILAVSPTCRRGSYASCTHGRYGFCVRTQWYAATDLDPASYGCAGHTVPHPNSSTYKYPNAHLDAYVHADGNPDGHVYCDTDDRSDATAHLDAAPHRRPIIRPHRATYLDTFSHTYCSACYDVIAYLDTASHPRPPACWHAPSNLDAPPDVYTGARSHDTPYLDAAFHHHGYRHVHHYVDSHPHRDPCHSHTYRLIASSCHLNK